MQKNTSTNKYQSFSGYGVDVAMHRADDLDKTILAQLEQEPISRVLELGCGAGGQAIRMAEAGAEVTAVDKNNHVTEEFKTLGINYIEGDIRELENILVEKDFDMVVVQRTLHYLKYNEAGVLLAYLKSITKGQLYISASGLQSEIGNYYAAAELPIKERFGRLSNKGIELFGIEEPVCLYTKDEFVAVLESAGWQIEKCWESAFKNLKAICF